MERKIISHRIGSILDDISRLSNALYAMDTTDIQRYPDNYEVLSTDAALRAENCLLYTSKEIMHDVYTQILAVSTIAAIVTASVALLLMNFSRRCV